MSVNSPRSTFERLGEISLSLITAAAIFSACSDGENRNEDVEDTTPPTVTVLKPFVSGNFNSYGVDYNRNCLYLTDSNGNTVDVVNRYDRESNIKDVWVSYYNEKGEETSRHTYNYNSRQPSKQDIYNSWKVLVKVSDTAWNVTKSDTVRVRIDKEEPSLMGLERLKNLYLEVGKAVNFLEWITYNWESAESLYRNGNVTVTVNGEIVEPLSYTPKAPGQIIIRLEFNKDNIQSQYEITKNVNAAEFEEISLPTLDLNSEFPWTKNINTAYNYKDFIFPMVQICALGKSLDNTPQCYIVWESASDSHWREWLKRYEALGASNTQFCDDWSVASGKPGIFSCAYDSYFTCYDKKNLNNDDNWVQYAALQNKIQEWLVVCALSNSSSTNTVIYNESSDWIFYDVSSINPKSLNPETGEYEENSWYKISVAGMPLNWNLTFGINEFNKQTTCLPKWYGELTNKNWQKEDNNNIVFIMPDVLSTQRNNSTSSFPTALVSALFSKIMGIYVINHGQTSYNNFMQYITNNYFVPVEYDSPIGKGSTVYTLNYDGFINDEILHQSELQRLDYTLNEVELPYYSYFLYTDPSITCNINWKDYASDDNNKKIILDAMENWEDIKWIRHKHTDNGEYKGTDDGEYKVYVVVNKEWENLNVEWLKATIRTDESKKWSPVYSNNQWELYQNSTYFEESNIGWDYTHNDTKVWSTLYNALSIPNYGNEKNTVPLQK